MVRTNKQTHVSCCKNLSPHAHEAATSPCCCSSDGIGSLMQRHMEKQAAAGVPAGQSELDHVVLLLGGMRTDGFTKLQKLEGDAKTLGVFR